MTKKPFLSGYRKYDASEGYGSPREWRAAFRGRMGISEALGVVGPRSPEELLGVPFGADWATIRRAYRQQAAAVHPDRSATHGLSVEVATERFKDLLAAYTILAEKYGKS